ncbi:ATP-dependent RNA helicase HAS1 [Apiospora arundinis]
MASTATPQGSLRQRNVPGSKKKVGGTGSGDETELDVLVKSAKQASKADSAWDYKIALAVITALAFISRFWGISHPNEVVFDEVHFGKVRQPSPR